MLPVSKDTLLRVVRRRSRPPSDPLRVIGIDDWAWRRNHRYAGIVCNLERRQVVTLLPDREPATAQAWLAAHPTIAIVARDRGGGYGEAAAKALPHAIQVADRWHLMENASRTFLDAVRKSMRQIRNVIGVTTIDPKLLTAAERLQYEGYLRREETNVAILALSKSGTPIKQIVRQTGYSWYDRRYAANAMMSSGPARAHSISSCHGWTISGRLAVEMELSSGVS
jgi:transposase